MGQEARSILLKAHECLQKCNGLLDVLSNLRNDFSSTEGCGLSTLPVVEQSFVELAQVWQAPLYEINLKVRLSGQIHEDKGGTGHCFILLCEWLLAEFVNGFSE